MAERPDDILRALAPFLAVLRNTARQADATR
jgi:hypothetical protein